MRLLTEITLKQSRYGKQQFSVVNGLIAQSPISYVKYSMLLVLHADGPRDSLSFDILQNAVQMVEELHLKCHAIGE